MKGNLTNLFVGGLVGLGMVGAMYYILPIQAFVFCSGLLGFEAYTLLNRTPHDTISETIWRFAKRPMFPFLFGVGVAEALRLVIFSHPYAVFFLGFLCGHFFFTPHKSTDYLEEPPDAPS